LLGSASLAVNMRVYNVSVCTVTYAVAIKRFENSSHFLACFRYHTEMYPFLQHLTVRYECEIFFERQRFDFSLRCYK
jgi:hypothetical protein